MSSNPLSYDGLKVVLQYLDATLRYQLSSCIPSIRVIEKLVPMRFDSITFNSLQTKVNETTYRLGVYREYIEGIEIPKIHREENERGGNNFDITEHGFDIHYTQVPVSPGDVVIRRRFREGAFVPPEVDQEQVQDRHQLLYERHLAVLERALKIRFQRGNGVALGWGAGDAQVYNSGLGIVDVNPEELVRIEQYVLDLALPLSAEKIREEILKIRVWLEPYYCRRDNIPPPFTPMIQLTVESPNGKEIYRHPYTIKQKEAMKKVNTALFETRKHVHQLRSLSVCENCTVIRLPVGFRIRIRELSVAHELVSICTALQSIVDDSSYPLNALTVSPIYFSIETYKTEIVKNAKQLNITTDQEILHFSCLPIICSLNNQSINLRCVFLAFSVQEQVKLIEDWIENGNEIETTFLSYQVKGTPVIDELLDEITEKFEGDRLDRNVRMLMNNGNILEVDCQLLENLPNEVPRIKWEVTMRVVAGQEEEYN